MVVMMVTMMMVMVMWVLYHDDLRLRSERHREAGCENESKPKLFHTLLWRFAHFFTELY